MGLQLRFEWDGDLRARQVFREPAAMNEGAETKRRELEALGWSHDA